MCDTCVCCMSFRVIGFLTQGSTGTHSIRSCFHLTLVKWQITNRQLFWSFVFVFCSLDVLTQCIIFSVHVKHCIVTKLNLKKKKLFFDIHVWVFMHRTCSCSQLFSSLHHYVKIILFLYLKGQSKDQFWLIKPKSHLQTCLANVSQINVLAKIC